MWIVRQSGKKGCLSLFKEKPILSSDGRSWIPEGYENDFPKGMFTFIPDVEDTFPELKFEDGPIEVKLIKISETETNLVEL